MSVVVNKSVRYICSPSFGCSNAPEINILNPKQDDNIENPPVSVEFEAKQNTTDLTSIDLSTLSAIISDNMNKTIDISQYIVSNCDFLKKNCSFKGEVNLEEGEYILQVRICNNIILEEENPLHLSLEQWEDIYEIHFCNSYFINFIQSIFSKRCG